MAIPSNTYKTYESIGNREDLIDLVTNITPVDTYVTSNLNKKKANATYHEWQTDALSAVDTGNAQKEGDDATASAVTPTVRTGNYCQIMSKVFQISGTEEAINKAGRDSEIAYQTVKFAKELARDMEYALVVNANSCAGSSNAARTLKGMDGWISDNCVYGGASIGASVALSEGILNDCLQNIWADGGKPKTVLCGAFQKRAVDAFSTNTREIRADAKALVSSVDVYKSSFGELAIRLHHEINSSIPAKMLILGDMELWNTAFLRPIRRKELAMTGDSTKFQMVAELTLESLQEKGSGKIAALTTS